MRLDRNANGQGKYAVINLRKVKEVESSYSRARIGYMLDILLDLGVLEYGNVGTEEEFFVLKLKDVHTDAAPTPIVLRDRTLSTQERL